MAPWSPIPTIQNGEGNASCELHDTQADVKTPTQQLPCTKFRNGRPPRKSLTPMVVQSSKQLSRNSVILLDCHQRVYHNIVRELQCYIYGPLALQTRLMPFITLVCTNVGVGKEQKCCPILESVHASMTQRANKGRLVLWITSIICLFSRPPFHPFIVHILLEIQQNWQRVTEQRKNKEWTKWLN